jgi:hypothetical protein
MKINVILLLISSIYTQFGVPCGNFTCTKDQGICMYRTENTTCDCFPDFSTYPIDNENKCNYMRKKQYVAFLLELCLTYGAGHLYTENYQLAVPKLFFWIVSYCLFIVLRMIIKSNEDSTAASLIVALTSYLFCACMICWQIADLALFGMNIYTDGNGEKLIPW